MANKKWYEWMLTFVYFGMALLCAYLNFTPGHKESLASIIVNIIMFIIVGIIFLTVNSKCFAPMNSIIEDLDYATDKIKSDALNTHSYLWEPYNNDNVELFMDKEMKDIFRDFIFDLNRNEDAGDLYYKPSIDDYVNEDLVDEVMHRNELNQVAGLLTGLGILGTFIGLSLGLQNFNTGTTAEMTESIEPLMNGIKVAFHTSIYGMVFSLTFNAIYKKKLYEAEASVRAFVSAFKKHVLPDLSNDGMNQLLLFQEAQLEAINDLSDNMVTQLYDLINPHLDKLHDIIVDFENVATANQTAAIQKVVEIYITEMNKSLGSSFMMVKNSVDEMYRAQTRTASMMQEVLDTTTRSNGNLADVNRETEKLVSVLNQYTAGIQSVINELQKTLDNLASSDIASRTILEKEHSLLAEQQDMLIGFKESMGEIARYTKETNADLADVISEMGKNISSINDKLDKDQSSRPGRR